MSRLARKKGNLLGPPQISKVSHNPAKNNFVVKGILGIHLFVKIHPNVILLTLEYKRYHVSDTKKGKTSILMGGLFWFFLMLDRLSYNSCVTQSQSLKEPKNCDPKFSALPAKTTKSSINALEKTGTLHPRKSSEPRRCGKIPKAAGSSGRERGGGLRFGEA